MDEELRLDRWIGRATPEDHIAWAVKALLDGRDSPSLRILAGLHPVEDRCSVDPYFVRSCAELGVTLDDPQENPRSAVPLVVARMVDLYRVSGYSDPLLRPWYGIQLAMEEAEDHGVSERDRRPADLTGWIEFEWRLFDLGLSLPLPPGFERFLRCEECGHIGTPHNVRVRSYWRGLLRYRGVAGNRLMRSQCSECGSSDLRPMVFPEVREDYYERLSKE